MTSELLNSGRSHYITLNKKFLQEVERGAPWEELQPLLDEMKAIAVHLQDIPTATDFPASEAPGSIQ